MSGEYGESCKTCGRPLLPVTAKKTGGLCRGCANRQAWGAGQARWEEERREGLEPLSEEQFAKLSGEADLERACHAVFEKAHWKWTLLGLESLSVGEVTVLAVETFFGETCNGGIAQYLFNESGALAIDLPEALVRVGLMDYAPVALALIRLFPEPIPRDPAKRLEAISKWFEMPGYHSLEELTNRFFNLYHRDEGEEFRRRLHEYIFSHRTEFVASRNS